MAASDTPYASSDTLALPSRARSNWGRDILRSLLRDRGGMLGLVLFSMLVFMAVSAPVLAPYNPTKQNLRVAKQPPVTSADGSWAYPLGTDNLGRDLLSRIIYGARVSLTVGFFGVLIAMALGMTAGLLAGYIGGRVDAIIMGVVNVLLALPYLLFVVVIAAILGRSLLNVILIFGVTNAPIFARVTRGEVLRLRRTAYVDAARTIGCGDGRILLAHLLPNMIGPLITVATFEMSAMIFYEAGLGFLGLSVPPRVPSWGNMLATGRQYLQTQPWIAAWPGLAIMIASLSMNLLGDWLRDAYDPRARRTIR
jgi:ABC-type dipeptide/oligopeptide/nickel transport system permease subunit